MGHNFLAFSEYLNFNGFHKLFEMMEHILLIFELQNANFDLFFLIEPLSRKICIKKIEVRIANLAVLGQDLERAAYI